MKYRTILTLSAAIGMSVLISGAANAASQYDKALGLCAAAIQEKLSIAPESYRQSIVRVDSIGSTFNFTLNVRQSLENGDKNKFKFYCKVRNGEVAELEQKK